MKKILLFLAIGSILPLSTFGHGLSQSIEQQAGDYIANLEYNRLELSAGETTTFSLSLLDKARNPVDFSEVLFEIYSGEKVLLSVFADKSENDEASLEYVFSEGGKYRAEVKFVKDGKGLAEAKFDLDVAAAEKESAWYKNNLLIGIVGGFVAGALLTLFSKRK